MRENLELELRFTETYRQHKDEHPALREIACLRAQYPAILGGIQDGDLFAGRLEFGAVGFSTQEQIGGTGYFCREEVLRAELGKSIDLSYREAVHEMLLFWRKENTISKCREAFPAELAEALPTDDWQNQPGVVFPIFRNAGTFLDYDKLLRLGIPGLYQEVKARRSEAAEGGQEAILFDCLSAALDLFCECCDHYALQARALAHEKAGTPREKELLLAAETLQTISRRKPESFREAIQLSWLYSTLVSALEYGRMDVYLGDFLAADLDSGELTEGEALDCVKSLWRLIRSFNADVDGRVIIGGKGRRNEENADRFALLAIEASRSLADILPQLTLRFYKGMNPDLMEKALDSIGQGRVYPLLYNDDVNVPAVSKAFAVTEEVAEQYVPLGCGEYVLDHMSFDTPSNSINLLKALEITLNNGRDPISGRKMGLSSGEFAQFRGFEELLAAWQKQMTYFIAAAADQQVLQYRVMGESTAYLFISLLYDDCLARGRALFSGGVRYLEGCLECYGNVNTADSLTAIKELVYDKKLISPQKLLAMLEANFRGYEQEQRWLRECPKYGNDHEAADSMLVRVHDFTCNTIRRQAKRVGLHSFLAVVINNAQNTTLATWVGASADGRRAGMAMANANNPASGNDRSGVTAFLNSIAKPDAAIHAGSVQNIRFSRELFDKSRDKVEALLETYFQRGGSQAMVTVIHRGDLEKALQEPEKYKDVFVRVGGFCARFVDLPTNVQQEILKRTTY